jgi:hypothetical protein
MRVVAFKPRASGSMIAFVDLLMDSGLVLLSCTFHTANGKRWVNPPGRPQLDSAKKLIIENGKIAYAPVIDFADKSLRFKWSAQAVKAIDEYLAAQSKAPTDEAGAMNGGEPTTAVGLPLGSQG